MLVVDESDPAPARLILYSNLPITCQAATRTNMPYYCWITLAIMSTEEIAMTQRLPYGDTRYSTKRACRYYLFESDWKQNEGFAYDNDRSLDIVAKVSFYGLMDEI